MDYKAKHEYDNIKQYPEHNVFVTISTKDVVSFSSESSEGKKTALKASKKTTLFTSALASVVGAATITVVAFTTIALNALLLISNVGFYDVYFSVITYNDNSEYRDNAEVSSKLASDTSTLLGDLKAESVELIYQIRLSESSEIASTGKINSNIDGIKVEGLIPDTSYIIYIIYNNEILTTEAFTTKKLTTSPVNSPSFATSIIDGEMQVAINHEKIPEEDLGILKYQVKLSRNGKLIDETTTDAKLYTQMIDFGRYDLDILPIYELDLVSYPQENSRYTDSIVVLPTYADFELIQMVSVETNKLTYYLEANNDLLNLADLVISTTVKNSLGETVADVDVSDNLGNIALDTGYYYVSHTISYVESDTLVKHYITTIDQKVFAEPLFNINFIRVGEEYELQQLAIVVEQITENIDPTKCTIEVSYTNLENNKVTLQEYPLDSEILLKLNTGGNLIEASIYYNDNKEKLLVTKVSENIDVLPFVEHFYLDISKRDNTTAEARLNWYLEEYLENNGRFGRLFAEIRVAPTSDLTHYNFVTVEESVSNATFNLFEDSTTISYDIKYEYASGIATLLSEVIVFDNTPVIRFDTLTSGSSADFSLIWENPVADFTIFANVQQVVNNITLANYGEILPNTSYNASLSYTNNDFNYQIFKVIGNNDPVEIPELAGTFSLSPYIEQASVNIAYTVEGTETVVAIPNANILIDYYTARSDQKLFVMCPNNTTYDITNVDGSLNTISLNDYSGIQSDSNDFVLSLYYQDASGTYLIDNRIFVLLYYKIIVTTLQQALNAGALFNDLATNQSLLLSVTSVESNAVGYGFVLDEQFGEEEVIETYNESDELLEVSDNVATVGHSYVVTRYHYAGIMMVVDGVEVYINIERTFQTNRIMVN